MKAIASAVSAVLGLVAGALSWLFTEIILVPVWLISAFITIQGIFEPEMFATWLYWTAVAVFAGCTAGFAWRIAKKTE